MMRQMYYGGLRLLGSNCIIFNLILGMSSITTKITTKREIFNVEF